MAKTQLPSQEKAKLLMEAVEDRLALNPVLLDLTGKTVLFDYALVCGGNSDTHIRAITNAALEKGDSVNIAPPRVAGQGVGDWVLMDYGDVVLHILTEEARERYKLETFWTTAQPKGALPPDAPTDGTVYAGASLDAGFNDSDEDDMDDEDADEMSDEELDGLDMDDDDAAFFDEADAEVEPVDEPDDIAVLDKDKDADKPAKDNG